MKCEGDYGYTKVYLSNNGTGTNALSAIISDNTWHHVCAIRNSDNTATLYVDGSQSGTPNQNAGSVSSGLYFIIGSDFKNGSLDFNGRIDDVRIYNRALSATEITNLYNLGR